MNMLAGLGIGVAALAIAIVVAFLIQAEAQDQIVATQSIDEANASTYTEAYNGSVSMQDATGDVSPWVPIIIVTVVGGLLVGMVSKYFTR